ncbi:MetQ/NlpA family ABC transporter substrate-binding protein [Senegalia massiliensis]|uniref:MetQ/NlpA family ABC transporter substrate-binding protein n=1 Tax=Senegalia massiliensis TaxID=1720316 RepID=UPI0010306C90|nr:MetQ/NlpA family ABC transporter substrate-binding protein [Senegalia massiliensis]
MKKLLIVLSLVTLIFVGCGNETDKKEDVSNLKIGATPIPHAELLNEVKEKLADDGITLEIVEFTDYVKPNLALSDGELDANFFQHTPYLEDFNEKNDTDLVELAKIHVEPLGLYSDKYEDVEKIEKGSTIAIPNDPTNGGRALLLLENEGLIKLDKEAGLLATEKDIVENPKELEFKALESAQIPRSLGDVDLAVINGNYALEADLVPTEDAILLEGKDSPYANVIAIRPEDKDNESLKVLVEALQSDEIKNFIKENYDGGVVTAY